jgi:hypothetical protein
MTLLFDGGSISRTELYVNEILVIKVCIINCYHEYFMTTAVCGFQEGGQPRYQKAIFWQSAAPFRTHSTILNDHPTSCFELQGPIGMA